MVLGLALPQKQDTVGSDFLWRNLNDGSMDHFEKQDENLEDRFVDSHELEVREAQIPSLVNAVLLLQSSQCSLAAPP